jgi:hypothetical protein
MQALSPVLAAVVLVAGCRGDDECAEYQVQCSGNTLRECKFYREGSGGHPGITYSSGYRWEDTDCKAATCLEVTTPRGRKQAVCALSKDTAPCKDTELEALGWACVGAELVACKYGYVIASKTCASADLCHPTYQDCLARPGLDPGCVAARPTNGGTSYKYCDGQVLVSCVREGYAMEVKDCGGPSLCFDFSTSVGCRLSTELDPRCSGDPQTLAQFANSPSAEGCNGTDQSFLCVDGFMVDDQRPCRNCQVLNNGEMIKCDP